MVRRELPKHQRDLIVQRYQSGEEVSGSCHGGNPKTLWTTPEVRDTVKLKKESYRVTLASKKFWQTVRRLRRGKQCSANTVYSAGGELLTSAGDIVRQWKEYFEDLLNPTDTPSTEEAEAGDSEVDSSITQAKVTEVVCKLLGGKALWVDERSTLSTFKSLDVVGLSWLTCLCIIAWRSGTVPLEWQTGVVVPLFKGGDRRVCSNYRGITLLSLPGKGLRQGTGEENSADSRTLGFRRNNAVFVLVVEHWTSSIPSTGYLRVYGSLPNHPGASVFGCLLREVFQACPTGRRPRGRPRTRLAWKRLGNPPEELEEVSGKIFE
ncbi:hypothetical protein L3Q82_001049 [Scortum barcoo]|uniref:Uncharacterized protein n=1 Tax=Scortum barcoo TaxID=214431 RepID=A0ACB8WA32_9TELE|nr:hypothetical protein L3Q82_001049 [Scortum barcoo]